MMSELHALERRVGVNLVAARLRQYMKAVELATRSQGDWQLAWALCDLPDHRPRAGALKESLAHPAELAAATSLLREQQALETALGNTRSDREPWWKQRAKKEAAQGDDGQKGPGKGGTKGSGQ